jgi:hypothetical protein
MSGAPLLDGDTLKVCAILKSRSERPEVPGGYATAIRDVLEHPHEAVGRMVAAHDAYHGALGVHAPAEAAARWGTLPERAAEVLANAGCAPALAKALADEGVETRLDLVAPQDHCAYVAHRLFDTDIDTLSLVLDALLDKHAISPDDAIRLFEGVACCLPVDSERLAWWIPPEAAEQLSLELSTEDPRVAHVPTDEPDSLRMLVQRASGRAKLALFEQDAHPAQTPEASAFFDEVERRLRGAARANEGWWKDPKILGRARKRIRGKGLVLPLPPLARPEDLDAVRQTLGTFPFVLGGRGPSPDDARVVRIEPEIDSDDETSALYYRGTVTRT